MQSTKNIIVEAGGNVYSVRPEYPTTYTALNIKGANKKSLYLLHYPSGYKWVSDRIEPHYIVDWKDTRVPVEVVKPAYTEIYRRYVKKMLTTTEKELASTISHPPAFTIYSPSTSMVNRYFADDVKSPSICVDNAIQMRSTSTPITSVSTPSNTSSTPARIPPVFMPPPPVAGFKPIAPLDDKIPILYSDYMRLPDYMKSKYKVVSLSLPVTPPPKVPFIPNTSSTFTIPSNINLNKLDNIQHTQTSILLSETLLTPSPFVNVDFSTFPVGSDTPKINSNTSASSDNRYIKSTPIIKSSGDMARPPKHGDVACSHINCNRYFFYNSQAKKRHETITKHCCPKECKQCQLNLKNLTVHVCSICGVYTSVDKEYFYKHEMNCGKKDSTRWTMVDVKQ